MSQQELLEEFAMLPAEAQHRVIELINSLKQEQRRPKATAAAKGVDIALDPFIGIWRDREELTDSSKWVRTIRRNEW